MGAGEKREVGQESRERLTKGGFWVRGERGGSRAVQEEEEIFVPKSQFFPEV